MIYTITPVAKPRQTQSDKWKKRPCVMRYRAFADECRLKRVFLPTAGAIITFHMPMPISWSKTKREQMKGKPHQQKPDWDNLGKALSDAVYGEDCHVWDVRIIKVWSVIGQIEIEV